MFKVEKNIPVLNSGCAKYPFLEMEVGDSFVADTSKRTSVSTRAKVVGDTKGMKFVTRAINENEIRCWRIA